MKNLIKNLRSFLLKLNKSKQKKIEDEEHRRQVLAETEIIDGMQKKQAEEFEILS